MLSHMNYKTIPDESVDRTISWGEELIPKSMEVFVVVVFPVDITLRCFCVLE